MSINEDQNLFKFYNNRNLNVNNKFLTNNEFLQRTKIPSNNYFINNLTREIQLENGNNNYYINNNNLFLNNVNINNYSINNTNNINNINKNFVKNRIEPNRLGGNLNLNDLDLNKFLNKDLTFNSNNNVSLNNNYINDALYSYNFNENKYNNNFDNDINNINTQIKLINFAKAYNNLNKDVNNINNEKFSLTSLLSSKKEIDKTKNIIRNNQNTEKLTLTSLLCSKKGINEIKSIIRNNPNSDIIRKIILTLNKENGLHIVFKNIYGNYFIQDLIEKMSKDLIQLTFELISSELVNISKSPSGTHCLQNLLNYINSSEIEIIIIKAIKYKEKEMAFDDNATYVLQKIITNIPDKKRTRLNNIIIENVKEFSLNANSVLVLKRFISTNTIEENKKKIINIIKQHFLVIAQNPFGNYVIQYLFDVWPIKDCQPIVNEILSKVISLSIERFSANIVIKSLKIFNNEYKQKIIVLLCFSSNIINLLKNKYSYYVINKAILYMDKDTKDKFKIYLAQSLNNISSSKEKVLINDIIFLLK